jgi:hypothetical protein
MGAATRNANYSPQSGKSFQVKLAYKVLVPCVSCVDDLWAGHLPNNCVNCVCWYTSSSLLETPTPSVIWAPLT